MSNYSKTTDFAAKDALTTGNANKIVKGTEIDDEFDAIQTAVNSKADKINAALTGTPTAPTASVGTNTTQIATTAFVQAETAPFAPLASPALTGTPTAPTASAGTDTTQIATTAFVQAALEAVYPVGSIYINSTTSTNPSSLLGFGTWTAFGSGRVMVGYNSSDSDYNPLEKTGGYKTHTLSVSEMPAHTHTYSALSGSGSGADNGSGQGSLTTKTTSSTGGGSPHNNLQPYIIVRMWKRTA
jgi:hypothetical protein